MNILFHVVELLVPPRFVEFSQIKDDVEFHTYNVRFFICTLSVRLQEKAVSATFDVLAFDGLANVIVGDTVSWTPVDILYVPVELEFPEVSFAKP
jgi:hypothetical protein